VDGGPGFDSVGAFKGELAAGRELADPEAFMRVEYREILAAGYEAGWIAP
jgi:hypothetical protein